MRWGLVVAGALLLGACGGNDGGETAAPTTQTTATSAPAAPLTCELNVTLGQPHDIPEMCLYPFVEYLVEEAGHRIVDEEQARVQARSICRDASGLDAKSLVAGRWFLDWAEGARVLPVDDLSGGGVFMVASAAAYCPEAFEALKAGALQFGKAAANGLGG